MMEDFKFYEVGGKIRDEFLGIKSKDVDYVAVPSKEVFDKIHLLERFTMIRMNLCGIMPNQLMGERLLLKV